ncbi:hypothetical protein CPB83DRAFT_841449 [Crepidotus variabilis]|uniref:Uncharacterized protein n=1 Tax=Crepidotus variabilis TaxID=179855 RepID=A0A9P6EV28_9AGAR|nr:hypothetical protein CPB83DRAFT_841449 [Crepidotus variabilis]
MHMKTKTGSGLSSSSYPKFYPHITLASLAHLQGLTEAIPQYETPIVCSFKSIDIGDVYYRSVYVSIVPDNSILYLHKRVHENLRIEPRTPSFPHMSLVYIDDEDAAKGERQRYYELLKDAGKFEVVGEAVKLCGQGLEDLIDGFEARQIWAVDCNGPVEGWQIIAKYSLLKV